MATAIRKRSVQVPVKGDAEKSLTGREKIAKFKTPELVIALCGPIGSPLHRVGEEIGQVLEETFGYEKPQILRLSDFIREHAASVGMAIPEGSRFDTVEALIDAGNRLRAKHGAGILAEVAISRIRLAREQAKDEETGQYHPRRVCHIIDSIKNQEELDVLRDVYRDMVYMIGVFSPVSVREKALRKELELSEIYRLIDKDSGEESENGQTVRDTFPQSDFFLRVDSNKDSQLKKRVERFLHLVLGTKLITPTPNESAMYAAAMAATNSACLSRQVGAAVTNSDFQVIGTGWNDVPKFGGGLYQASSPSLLGDADEDGRCWNTDGGKCFNDAEKKLFAKEMVATLKGIIPAEKEAEAQKALEKAGKLKGLIEFSRAIHAEMHAIINATRTSGDAIVGGKLFVTTYPCHSCARHIVAAGISEVYFIEPYRKSLAMKLHNDAVTEHESEVEKVRILAYDGVAPSRYLSLFKIPSGGRKRDGKIIKINAKSATPKLEKNMEALAVLEAFVVSSLAHKKLVDANGGAEDGPDPAAA
ncbi:anti-phage dCTP deaminase [Cupriavidus sp. WKF15]|uniref:anti-phage dCTP deaminase n=1 Tax=Cupriavidus sp. WKF15 TaxID=3032282 RepID=UPI0023E268AE|nr:anti-phage dCTP deaminase [Cupriavidus sp. WKF15]WER45594.1 anti-phage dCTP deaminase [Cupriavidus sp. WKF15]